MSNVEQIAFKTYKDNLVFFEKNYPDLYKKVITLEAAIQSSQYKEHYALEYKEEGYFDILELSSNEFLYKGNSLNHAANMLNIIDKKRTGAIFKALKFVKASEEQAEHIDKSDLSFHNSLWATIKIIKYVEKYAHSESYMRKVPKVIFLGLGLGIHLKEIIKKLNAQVVYISEPNLEIFRLSLFVTNYVELSKDRFFYFSITSNEEEDKKVFLEFLNKGNNYNLHIKHIPFFDKYASGLKRLQEYVLSQSYVNYGYSGILLRYIESPRYLAQGYNFLNVNKIHENNIFSKKPLLLLFSGPSTSKHLDWIKKNHDKFIIVSALSTCRLLNKIDISPDIVLHIDPGEKTSKLFEGLDTSIYFQNTIVLLASNVNEDTVSRFKKSQIHFVEQGTNYKKGFGRLSAPSVGEYAYGLFMIFGARKLYMLGIDLSLDNETLQSHGDYHFANTKGTIDETSASLDPNSSVEYIRGNLRDKIPTVSGYKISIEQFKIFTDTLKKDYHEVYNLSDGVYLEGAEPLFIEKNDWNKLNDFNKSTLYDDVNNLFNDIGSSDFSKEDKEQLIHQLVEAKKLKKQIKKFQKKKFTNSEKFLVELTQLSWNLSDMDYKNNSDLAQVYYEYFPIIQSYIFDLFNTQKLDDEKKHIIEIDRILITQLLKICNLYIQRMDSYLK